MTTYRAHFDGAIDIDADSAIEAAKAVREALHDITPSVLQRLRVDVDPVEADHVS